MSAAPRGLDFILAFREKWFAAMSGGASVPFAALAVNVDNKYAQLVFWVMAFSCVWFASYQVWEAERAKVLKLDRGATREALLAEVAQLRDRMAQLRIDMEADPIGVGTRSWGDEFHSLEAEIAAKVDQIAGKAEANIYRTRGNIERRRRVQERPHHLYIDLAIHDLDYLRAFVQTYSRLPVAE